MAATETPYDALAHFLSTERPAAIPATAGVMATLETLEEELCRRIVQGGDREACWQLAALYRRDGSVSLIVPLMRAGDGDSYCWQIAFRHAIQVLGLSIGANGVAE